MTKKHKPQYHKNQGNDDDWKYSAPQWQCEKLASRMKNEWLRHKEEQKTTQTKFAAKLGVTQSAFNQFISGTCPIRNEMILIMCREMNVDPQKMVAGLPFFQEFFHKYVAPGHCKTTNHSVAQAVLSNAGGRINQNTSHDVYSVTATDLENIKAVLQETPSDFIKTWLLKYYTRLELIVSIIIGRTPKV